MKKIFLSFVALVSCVLAASAQPAETTLPYIDKCYTLGEDGISVNPTPQLIKVQARSHNMYGEFCDFAKIIEEDLPVTMSALEGAKSIAACLAIVESAKTGVPVKPNYEF